jgi:hypothetical protein
MRCRSAIAHWVYEKGLGENVIELLKRDDETFVRFTDVKIEYCSDYLGQMMEYGKKYSFLPVY